MSDRQPKSDGGLSLQTLLISAASAVIATVVVSQFWAAGTLFFTAFVPVTVAIVSEILRRPAEKITAVAPLVAPRVVPGLRTDRTEVREPEAPEPPPPPAGRDTEADPFGLYERSSRSPLTGRVLKLGLITGLLAFVVAAAFVTASELALFDGSIGGNDRRTTLVGGSSSKKDTSDAEKTATPDPEATPGATETATPEETETPDPKATPTETPSASPTPTPTPTPSPAAAAPTATPAP